MTIRMISTMIKAGPETQPRRAEKSLRLLGSDILTRETPVRVSVHPTFGEPGHFQLWLQADDRGTNYIG
jgi:hypothetical protein